MNNRYIKYLFFIAVFISFSCEDLVDDMNDNPNQLTLDDIEEGLFLNGAELANINIQLGSYSRMAGYWSGQLIGFEQVELERYQYNVTSSTFDWNGYQSVLTPLREIRGRAEDNALLTGVTKVLEAHLVGTYASLFGDIPYSETVGENSEDNPAFDDQLFVFEQLQDLLDEAILDIEAGAGDVLLEDYIFQGNQSNWLESAWTLKARYFMHTKQYDLAYAAAENGISGADNNMMFDPLDIPDENSTKNKYFIVFSNGPNTGTGDSYLMQLLDDSSAVSRNNAKTNELARSQYYTIDQSLGEDNLGIAEELEPQPMITYSENLLILAEAGARSQSFDVGLAHLNELRAYLNTGDFLNANFSDQPYLYEPYVAADFSSGGMENEDGIEPARALLREIVEERYVSGFTTYMPYDDSRRLRSSDSDIAVPFPLNVPTSTQNVERMLYPDQETESNSNASPDPGLYSPTRVNQ